MTTVKRERPKLHYRFHDPNPPGVIADYLVRLLVEVNLPKAEAAVRAAAEAAAQAPRRGAPRAPAGA